MTALWFYTRRLVITSCFAFRPILPLFFTGQKVSGFMASLTPLVITSVQFFKTFDPVFLS